MNLAMFVIAAVDRNAWKTMGPRMVGIVVAALIVVWTGVFVAEWLRSRRQTEKVRQSSLFDQLCQAHGLDIPVQQQLALIAKERAHGDLILPFLDPRVLELAAKESPDLSPLGRQLFGDAWQEPAPA
ncbi:MAG TPA: hypothetical protein VFG20_03890 [Planctomycetaceae bacterium]|jgi:hypothetical protein|nr:hypothetical protein [Planctomycetaceae bacterium]